MAMTVAEMQVVVSADTSKAESGLSSLGSKVSGAGAAMAAGFAIAGAAMAAGVGLAVKAAGDLEQAVANISTLKPEIDTSAVSTALSDMSTRVAQSSGDLADSLYNVFSSVEVSQEQALMLTEQFARGAVAAQTDAATFGTAVMGVMNAYGMSVDEAAHISDVFFNTVKLGVVTGPELAASLGPVTQSAKAAGVNLDELGAMIAAVTKEGGPAAQNINNLNNFLQKVTTKDAQAELNAMGIATKTATGEFRPTADVLTDLKARLGGMTEAARANALQAIFPDAQARIGAATLISQLDLVTSATAENATATGVADAAYAKMAATFNNQSKILVNSLMAVATTIGAELLPIITPLITTIAQQLPQAFKDARAAIEPALTQIADSVRTVQQVFAEGWLPSDQVPPFVNAVGIAAQAVKDFVTEIDTIRQKLSQMGIAEAFAIALGNISKNLDAIPKSIETVNESAGRLNTAFGGAEGKASALALALKGVAITLVIVSAAFSNSIDGMITLASVANDLVTVVVSAGKALFHLATGDMPAMTAAANEGNTAFASMIETGTEFAGRNKDRVVEAFNDIAAIASSGMAETSTAVEVGMAVSTAAVDGAASEMAAATEAGMGATLSATETGMAGVAAATETGMAAATAAVEAEAPAMAAAAEAGAAGAVAAVEGQVGAASAAGTAMGTGMAAGVETAAPQMEAAASAGASGAVAAVQGQTGAASGAGQSLGTALGSGLEGGILAYVGRVAAAAANLVSAAIGAARVEAQAESPSKATEKLGQDLATGMEIGLNASNLGEEMQTKIRDFIAASREYIPTGREIAQVEEQIANIRKESQTDALFRGNQMIVVESEALRLKKQLVEAERDLLPVRREIASTSRQIADIEDGTLSTRRQLIAFGVTTAEQNIKINALEKEKIPLRAKELEIERALIGLDPSSKRAKGLKEEQDELRNKNQLIDNTISQIQLQTRAEELDTKTIKEQQTIASAGARIRQDELGERLRAQEENTTAIKDQIGVLNAEADVFAANEAIIKNATQNEITYRNQLIAVFNEEGKELQERITAGKGLLEQLHNEGKISDELYNAVKKQADILGTAATKTDALSEASRNAKEPLETAASAADRMAQQAADIARDAANGAREVDALSRSLNRLPDWFTPTGRRGQSLFSPRAIGGPVSAGGSFLVGEQGPELFVPRSSGTIVPSSALSSSSGGPTETVRVEIAVGDRVAEEIYVTGRQLAIRRGRVSSGVNA